MIDGDSTEADGVEQFDESGEHGPTTLPLPSRVTTLSAASGQRYRLGGEIASGGMGEILSAIDMQFHREVAVKRMKQSHPSERSMDRFFREAAVQGRLDHPAIVPVHELGVDADGRPFFTMKKLTGTTLAARIADGVPRARLLRAFADVCLAIEFAHGRGVIHRDLKPSNIVVGDYGDVYVLDWGVAKVLDEQEESHPRIETASDVAGPAATIEGAVVGTYGYMAPEQARGQKDIDARTDVHALGCILFEILAGSSLYPGGKAGLEAVLAGRTEVRPSLRAPLANIAPELDATCVDATRTDREARIATARELAERVERYLDGDRDLALRQQLARAHLESARDALVSNDVDHHRVAIREAARSLALDPQLDGAAELVGRLMLEPPAEVPAEVQRQIADDNMNTLRRQARAGAMGYFGYLAFVPVLLVGGTEMVAYAVGLVALVVINVVFLVNRGFYDRLTLRAWAIAIGTVAIIAFLSRLSSPFLIAPGVAALGAIGLSMSPTYARARSVAVLGVAIVVGMLGPWFAEQLGFLSRTVSIGNAGITIDAPLFQGSPLSMHATIVLYVVAIVAAGIGIGHANRRLDIDVRHRLHMQAWQLRQLANTADRFAG